jgi:polyphosphate kinase
MPTRRLNNRELSWLEFNARVLEEARDPTVPLLERLRFLAIFSSNLDEFFMVRVAGLRRQIDAGVTVAGDDGRAPVEVMCAVAGRAHELVAEQHRIMLKELIPDLAAEGIHLVRPQQWSPAQVSWLRDWFHRNALPVVTPIAIDPGHPFPHLANRALCLALELQAHDEEEDLAPAELCILHVEASVLPRFLRLPAAAGRVHVALLEDVIRLNLDVLFRNATIRSAGALRVTRDAELDYDEDRADDLLRTIETAVRNRRMGGAVRLQHEPEVSDELLPRLRAELELNEDDVYEATGFTAFADLFQLYALVDRPDLKFPAWIPRPAARFARAKDVFRVIDRGDVLVHHPYQSFDAVVRFLEASAQDPEVLAIKITLYRMTKDSRIAQALLAAAQNGKSVVALIELRARFNEESNIAWAKRLEDAGAHVVYGISGLKTHAKALLVVRRTASGIRRYVHLGTGNYNEANASIYSDLSLFTSRESVGEDVTWLFNLLTGYARPPAFSELIVAPLQLRDAMVERIRREAQHARAGGAAGIVLKLNSLVDRALIEELYAASRAGVAIDLIVRGICCLRPGVRGLSERIRAVRIVDRFLEHARIFRFENAGDPEYLLSSADWMPRNLDGRIEIAFPVRDPKLRREIDAILALQMADNVKGSRLSPDGGNERIVAGGEAVRSQAGLMRRARRGG